MPDEYNVRFKNKSSEDINYVAVHPLAQVQGSLDQNEHDDYVGPYALYGGPRAVIVSTTFPPAIRYSQVVNINHDFTLIKILDTHLDVKWGAPAPSGYNPDNVSSGNFPDD